MFKKKSMFILLVFLITIMTMQVSAEVVSIGGFEFNVYDINGYVSANFAMSRGGYITKDGQRLLIVENQSEKEGIIDVQGNVIIPLQYDYIGECHGDYVIVNNNDYAGVINYKTGEIVLDLNNYNFIKEYGGYFAGIRRDGNGDNLNDQWEVLPFNVSQRFKEYYIVQQEDYLKAIFYIDQRQMTPYQYDRVDPYAYNGETYFVVCTDEIYGMIDGTGKVVLENKYNYFSIERNSTTIDLKGLDGYEYVYDLDTKTIKNKFEEDTKKYEQFEVYDDNTYFFRDANTSGLMDKNYKVIECINEYQAVRRYENGLYEILGEHGDRYLATYTYKDAKGERVSKTYDYADEYNDDPEYIIVNKFDKRPTSYGLYWGFGMSIITFYHGDEVIDPHYGVINSKGEEIIPCEYDRIFDYDYRLKGLFMVEQDGKKGFINAKNEVVIPIEYDTVRPSALDHDTNCTIAVVGKDGRYGLINNQGKMIYPCVFNDEIVYLSNDRIIITVDGLTGAIDSEGNVVIPFIYETEVSYEFRNGLAIFAKGQNSFSQNLDTGEVIKELAVSGVVSYKNDVIIPFGELISASPDCSVLILTAPEGIRVYELISTPADVAE